MLTSFLSVASAVLVSWDAKRLLLSKDSKARYLKSPGWFMAQGAALFALAIATATMSAAGLVAITIGGILLACSAKNHLMIAEQKIRRIN